MNERYTTTLCTRMETKKETLSRNRLIFFLNVPQTNLFGPHKIFIMNFIECHKIRSLNRSKRGEMVDVLREACLNDGEILSVYCNDKKKCHFAINIKRITFM